jgi:hypothetical protein
MIHHRRLAANASCARRTHVSRHTQFTWLSRHLIPTPSRLPSSHFAETRRDSKAAGTERNVVVSAVCELKTRIPCIEMVGPVVVHSEPGVGRDWLDFWYILKVPFDSSSATLPQLVRRRFWRNVFRRHPSTSLREPQSRRMRDSTWP